MTVSIKFFNVIISYTEFLKHISFIPKQIYRFRYSHHYFEVPTQRSDNLGIHKEDTN